jgi:hypothetical protein
VTLASILAMPNLQSDTVQLKYAAFSQGTDDMAQEQELASALRGTKTVARAFFTAVDAMPEPQRRAVAAAALDLIRDDMKAQREQAAAVAAKAKTAKAPAKTARAPAKAARKAAKKAAPVRRARKTKAPAAAPAAPQAQTGNGAAAEA